jgi:hypothetical protein
VEKPAGAATVVSEAIEKASVWVAGSKGNAGRHPRNLNYAAPDFGLSTDTIRARDRLRANSA